MELLKDLEQGTEILKKDLELLSNSISNIGLNEDKTIDTDQAENALDRVVTSYENVLIDIDNLKKELVDITKPKLNILKKIQKARVELQKKDLKKTGHNKYSNYKYFELGDFLPYINEICDDLGLYTEFEYGEKEAFLYVIDTDNPDIKRRWNTPVEVAQLKGCSTIQNIGGTQSFARRYLYMMAFEIAETDTIDGGEVDEEAIFANQKINKAQVFTINKLIAETNTDIDKFLAWANVSKIEDITNEMFNGCIKSFNDKKKKLDQEKSLKQQQEEHQKELEKQKEDVIF